MPAITYCVGEYQLSPGFAIAAIDDAGLTGLGEAAPLFELGTESLAETELALAHLRSRVIGKSIASITEITILLSGFEAFPAARHGIELALLDLLARSQKIPLARLLNPLARKSVMVNGLIGAVAPEAAIEQAMTLVSAGYTCLKVKVGADSREQDLQRLTAIRQAVGDHVKIRIDANQSWSVDQAIAQLNQFEPLGIEYVEQPVAAANRLGMAEVRAAVGIAIAADESVLNTAQLLEVITYQAADIIILKPMLWGGLLNALSAANLALHARLDIAVTTTLDGAIARMGALHLAAALPQIHLACGLATGYMLAEDLVALASVPEGSEMALAELPGLGLPLF